MSPTIHNIAFISEKVVLSESGEKYTIYENSPLEALFGFRYLHFGDTLKLKCLNDGFVSYNSFSPHKRSINGLELWIIMMLLSAVWTLILTAPIHCRWSSDVMLHFSKSDLWVSKFIFRINFTRHLKKKNAGLICETLKKQHNAAQ